MRFYPVNCNKLCCCNYSVWNNKIFLYVLIIKCFVNSLSCELVINLIVLQLWEINEEYFGWQLILISLFKSSQEIWPHINYTLLTHPSLSFSANSIKSNGSIRNQKLSKFHRLDCHRETINYFRCNRLKRYFFILSAVFPILQQWYVNDIDNEMKSILYEWDFLCCFNSSFSDVKCFNVNSSVLCFCDLIFFLGLCWIVDLKINFLCLHFFSSLQLRRHQLEFTWVKADYMNLYPCRKDHFLIFYIKQNGTTLKNLI